MKLITVCSIGLSFALFGTSAIKADGIPIAGREFYSFYTLQLRGVSYEPTGQSVEVYVFDMTYDNSAYGQITITDISTSSVLFDKTYGNLGNYGSPGEAINTLTLPYNTPLAIDISGKEFSRMGIIIGSETVAAAGWYNTPDDVTYNLLITITPPDADGDGVSDFDDQCPNSILTPTILVGACDTGVPNTVNEHGCTLAQQLALDDVLASAAAGAKNHGGFVSTIARYLGEKVQDGVITEAEHEAIMNCVGATKLP